MLPLYEPVISLGSRALEELRIYVGPANRVDLNVTLADFDPQATGGLITISVEATESSLVSFDRLEDLQWRHLGMRSLTVEGLVATSNFTAPQFLVFTVHGSTRYKATKRLRLVVLDLLEFESRNVPSEVFVGDANSRSFVVWPREVVDGALYVVARSSCEAAVVTVAGEGNAEILWNRTNEPATLTLTGVDASTSCIITVSQKAGATITTVENDAFSQSVTVIDAPTLSLLLVRQTDVDTSTGGGSREQVATSVAAEVLRQESLQFQLTIGHTTFVNAENLTVGISNDSAITVSSNVNETDETSGFNALLSKGEISITFELNPSRTRLGVTLSRAPRYRSYTNERVTFRLNPEAVLNSTVPDPRFPGRWQPFLDILADARAPPTRAERQALEATTFATTVMSGLVSTGAAAQMGRVLSIGSISDCPSRQNWIRTQDNMPEYITPIPIRLGPNDALGVYAGATLGNAIVVVGFLAIHFACCVGLQKLRGSAYDHHAVKSTLHFPSLVWLPIVLFFQVTLMSATLLLLYSPWTSFKILGSAVFLVLAVLVPGIVIKVYLQTSELIYIRPLRRNRFMWFFERGSHAHPQKEHWVNMYAVPFFAFRGEARWWFIVEIVFMIVLAVITAVQPETEGGCLGRSIVAMILFVVQLVMVIIVQPYSSKFDNFFFIAGYLFQAAAMAVVLNSTIRKTMSFDEAFALSGKILLGFAAMLVVKAFVDWARLIRSALRLCAVLDPLAERNFRSAQDDRITLTKDGAFTDEPLLEIPKDPKQSAQRDAAVVAATVCTTDTVDEHGKKERLRGFHRSFDPLTAALSHSRPEEHAAVKAASPPRQPPTRRRGDDLDDVLGPLPPYRRPRAATQALYAEL